MLLPGHSLPNNFNSSELSLLEVENDEVFPTLLEGYTRLTCLITNTLEISYHNVLVTLNLCISPSLLFGINLKTFTFRDKPCHIDKCQVAAS